MPGFRGSLRPLGKVKGQATADLVTSAAVAAWKRAAAGVGAAVQHPEAFDLASAVVRRMLRLDEESGAPVIAHSMVQAGGAIQITTAAYLRAQSLAGRTLCRGCGFFFGTGGPLRQHASSATSTRCLDLAAAEYYEKPCRDDGLSLPQLERSASRPEYAAGVAAVLVETAVADSASVPPAPERPKETDGQPHGQLEAGIVAARDGELHIMQQLVSECRWDPLAAADHHGNGPLHWAAGSGHLAVCRWLVEECGLDPGKTNAKHHGRSALHWAARNGHEATCQWLLQRVGNSHVDVETDGGDTPLMLAAWQGHVGVCRLLALARADVHHLNSWGCNAMHKAARMDGSSSSLEMLKFLHERGCDPQLVNCNGHNALHKAAQHGSSAAVSWLFDEAGCRTRLAVTLDRDRNSPSALAYAAGYRGLASEMRHVEDVLWLAPALFHPPSGKEDGARTP
ncbi:unnamed protein product [Prorocentrum cordatum]|uniref:Uncharacterized protein n=1 Tax=Prorocentrum cordatum TaxID=2364126 RepID=A0ABN9VIQ2_9DINO|nr:unnamed protein product [Polarella glacialis]